MSVPRRSALAALLLTGCSRFDLLNGANALVPGDGGVRRVVEGAAFGADPRQALDVHAPAGAKGLPVLVFFYGGSWASGRRQDYGFAARALAARGFVIVVPDYRLVPHVRFPAFVEDGAAAIAWTRANIAAHGGDPARIAVIGHSAGAHIALLLALDRRWGAAATITAAIGLAGPYDFRPFEPGGAADAAFAGTADLAVTQPISFARGDAPPLLLLTGDADTTVRPGNSDRLAAAVTAAGGRAEVRHYPGVGHIGILLALSKPFRGKAPVLADTLAFLRP
ncbi:alpha/beta hydrolase [alpha proteobacterium AAP81b]|nr:alpha/beta hydrolase [alpha proteobacterium AAP81b]